MENAMIAGILIIFILVGIPSGLKHFKGEGGCCGGASAKVKRKHLKHVIKKRCVSIEGMTCKNCKNRVEGRLNELGGVSARVSLKNKNAIVSMETEVSDEEIKQVIERAGYAVTNISEA